MSDGNEYDYHLYKAGKTSRNRFSSVPFRSVRRPAGWFGEDFERLPNTIMLVEGAFDRLTLLVGGFAASDIVALVGTAVQVDWLPAQVKTVVLALNGDEGGKEASSRLADQLTLAGLRVQLCPSLQDTCGKDWNERWQRLGQRSVIAAFEAFCEARSA